MKSRTRSTVVLTSLLLACFSGWALVLASLALACLGGCSRRHQLLKPGSAALISEVHAEGYLIVSAPNAKTGKMEVYRKPIDVGSIEGWTLSVHDWSKFE